MNLFHDKNGQKPEAFPLMIPVKHTPAVSGILLVTGTCIGAGMLALPVVTGLAGFLPAIAINILCCLFMITTGLLLLEVILWSQEGANVLTLSEQFLGRWGKIVAGGSFLFYYYCLEVSYCAGGTPTLTGAIASVLGDYYARRPGTLVFFSLQFSELLSSLAPGRRTALTRLLMAGLIVSFFLLVIIGSTEVYRQAARAHRLALHAERRRRHYFAPMPRKFSSFAIRLIYKGDISRFAHLCDHWNFSPFIVYEVWQSMIIGTLPYDEILAAEEAWRLRHTALTGIVGHPYLSFFRRIFWILCTDDIVFGSLPLHGRFYWGRHRDKPGRVGAALSMLFGPCVSRHSCCFVSRNIHQCHRYCRGVWRRHIEWAAAHRDGMGRTLCF